MIKYVKKGKRNNYQIEWKAEKANDHRGGNNKWQKEEKDIMISLRK